MSLRPRPEEAFGAAKTSRLEAVLAIGHANNESTTARQYEAPELLEDAKELWDGAKNPALWQQIGIDKLVKRLKTDYRRYFKESDWKNIVLSKGATLYYIIDTGANLFCELNISASNVTAKVYSKPYTFYENKRSASNRIKLGDKIAVQTRSFKSVLTLIDSVILSLVQSYKTSKI